MGVLADQEICQTIGVSEVRKFIPTIEECHNLKVYTQESALHYLGSKLVAKRYVVSESKIKHPWDEAKDLLATTILAHIPVEKYNFKSKSIYLGLMVNS